MHIDSGQVYGAVFGVVILAVEMPLVVPDQLAETGRKKQCVKGLQSKLNSICFQFRKK